MDASCSGQKMVELPDERLKLGLTFHPQIYHSNIYRFLHCIPTIVVTFYKLLAAIPN